MNALPPQPANPGTPIAQATAATPALQPPAPQPTPRKPLLRQLLLAATCASILSILSFIGYLLLPVVAQTSRDYYAALYTVGVLGLLVAEICQILGVVVLLVKWFSRTNPQRKLRELIILLVSLIPYMVVVIFLITLVVYLRARAQDPNSPRTRAAARELKERTVDAFIDAGGNETSNAAGSVATPVAARPAAQPGSAPSGRPADAPRPAWAKPSAQGAIRRVIGPSTSQVLSGSLSSLVAVMMSLLVVSTVAAGAAIPVRLLGTRTGALASSANTPATATPSLPTATTTPAGPHALAPIALPAPGGSLRYSALAVAPDKTIWLALNRQLYHVAADGTYTTIQVPVGVWEPVIAPDGTAWFTEFNSNTLGHVSANGAVSEVTPNVSNGLGWSSVVEGIGLGNIAIGPDQNLWVNGGGSLWDYSPSGALTRYKVPQTLGSVGASGFGGVSGGYLWFAADVYNFGSETSAICRSDAHGNMACYSVPNSSIINGITIGPDGNAWFTASFDKKAGILGNNRGNAFVGEVSPSGAIQTFSLSLDPGAIITGADGNLWIFSVGGGWEVADAMSPAGTVVKTYSMQGQQEPSSGIWSAAVGPDGTIWYTDPGYAQIDRVAP